MFVFISNLLYNICSCRDIYNWIYWYFYGVIWKVKK